MTTHLRVLEPAFPASFESALHRLFSPTQFDLGVQPLQMRLDVSEKDNAYQVKVDLPGVEKEDINVRIDGNVVQIDAEIKQEKETKGDGGKARVASAITVVFRVISAFPRTSTTARRKPGIPMAC